MIGIVLVSHSPELAAAALGLARQMVPEGTTSPRVAIAAGAGMGVLGTDAVRVAEAIGEVSGPDGVLVIMDLGSAVLSAELAVELAAPDVPVKLVAAPFVEGLLAGLVRAAGGASLDEVAREAAGALAGKQAQLPDAAVAAAVDAKADATVEVTAGMTAEPGAGPVAASAPAASAAPAPSGAAPAVAEPVVSVRLELVNADGLHARPAATLSSALSAFTAVVGVQNARTGREIADASSMVALLSVDGRPGDELTFTATGPDADAAIARVTELVGSGFGEAPAVAGASGAAEPDDGDAAAAGEALPAPVEASHVSLAGQTPTMVPSDAASSAPLGVSGGRVAAVARVMAAPVEEPPDGPAPVPDAERQAVVAGIPRAFEAVADALRTRAGRVPPEHDEAIAILEATAALASDRTLARGAVDRVVRDGVSPERAVWLELTALSDQLAALGGRQAERAADVRDVRARVIARLTGAVEPGVPDSAEPFVLVAHELAPADTALLGATDCVGIVTAVGGPTSHTAILARSLGLPAVVWAGASGIADGVVVLIDGSAGEIVIDPSPELRAAAPASAIGGADASSDAFDGDGRLADGTRIALRSNLGRSRDVAAAARAGAQGVGLLRTEFLFLDRQTEPTVDEQAAEYRAVLEAFGAGNAAATAAAGAAGSGAGAAAGRATGIPHTHDAVVIRTLDAGSDKPLAFVAQSPEPNPALGVRGYRTAALQPELLERQLDALALAARAGSRAGGPEFWVMAPMIATAAEAHDFVAHARAAGLGSPGSPARLGVMIETPAAALTIDEVLAEVDFVSIGTNDLTQYTMAADRELGSLAGLSDAWQPAVLRLIGLIGEGGRRSGKPIGVCGEAGGDPALAPVLVGLGLTSLSMTPRALAAVARSLAGATLEQCRAAAQAALAASAPAEARAAAAAALGRA